MALSLGKLTLLVGAGILGSVLAKEGRIPSVSDVLSGALKIALKPIRQNDSANTTSKPHNDALVAQVNSLRKELQLLASDRSVTVVTSSAKGGLRYGVIIVIVVIGCGYVWWKGWKLSEFMFVTQREFEDARHTVAEKAEQVYTRTSDMEKDLSSKVDGSTGKYDDIVTFNDVTKDKVAENREEVQKFPVALQFMMQRIEAMETKADAFEGKQVQAIDAVEHLKHCVSHENDRYPDLIQDSPSSSRRPALEHPQITTSSRTGSLPLVLSLELPSPSAANGSSEASQGISGAVDNTPGPRLSNGNHVSPRVYERSPTLELPQRQQPIFRRTISATQYFK